MSEASLLSRSPLAVKKICKVVEDMKGGSSRSRSFQGAMLGGRFTNLAGGIATPLGRTQNGVDLEFAEGLTFGAFPGKVQPQGRMVEDEKNG